MASCVVNGGLYLGPLTSVDDYKKMLDTFSAKGVAIVTTRPGGSAQLVYIEIALPSGYTLGELVAHLHSAGFSAAG